jgi:3-hydroxybutyryl-CoA dehydrogenase
MGTSMALIFAEKGYKVTILYRRESTAEKSKATIQDALVTEFGSDAKALEKQAEIWNNITYSNEVKSFSECDLIVESIAENMEIKHKYWKKISDVAKPDALLATNTSGLSITDIASVVKNKDRFVGMHWFNPPHIIPLIEVIKGDETSDATAQAVFNIAQEIGKKPVMVQKDAKGFIANRLQVAVLREALHIVEEGIGSYKDVDDAMKYGIGFRYACLGPFEVVYLGGLDVFHSVSNYLYSDLAADQKPQQLFDTLVKEGKLGVKNGEGFYDYHNGKDKEAIEKRDKKFLTQAQIQKETESN